MKKLFLFNLILSIIIFPAIASATTATGTMSFDQNVLLITGDGEHTLQNIFFSNLYNPDDADFLSGVGCGTGFIIPTDFQKEETWDYPTDLNCGPYIFLAMVGEAQASTTFDYSILYDEPVATSTPPVSTGTIMTIPYYSTIVSSTEAGLGLIDQSWTYGELFIAFLVVFFIGYTIIKDILRFFFPDKIRVLRIKDAL